MGSKKEEIDRLANALICIGAVSSSSGRANSTEEMKLPILRGLYRVAGVLEAGAATSYGDSDEIVCSLCGVRYPLDSIGKTAMSEHVNGHARCAE